jgi:hypothetical protein
MSGQITYRFEEKKKDVEQLSEKRKLMWPDRTHKVLTILNSKTYVAT